MKRNRTSVVLFIVLIFLLVFAGCAGTQTGPADIPDEAAADKAAADEVSAASAEGWEIRVTGMREDSISAAGFEEAKEHSSHYQKVSFDKKGEMVDYRAMPFRYIVAMVDGEDAEHPWLFNTDAWEAGYDITLTAADGYASTFNTADVGPNELYLADEMNGEKVLPRIVGDVSTKIQIKDLVSIELSLGDTAVQETITLEVEVNDEVSAFTREELEGLPYYIEDTGSYTTSAGTTHTHQYGGIKFGDFLRSYVDLEEASTVQVTAMDGYTMSYSAGDLLDESEGTWILAFKSDGEYLSLDPGYFRTVKVGPSNPNIDGHSSARMVKRISVSGEVYQEYDLLITGRMDNRLDRQTIQSGVSCHTKTVEYLDKKSGETSSYTGIPLWLLLAYGDDADHAPHRQTDKSILSYKEETAREGYSVEIVASDGYSITLDSKQLNKNDDVILATLKEGESLPEREWPLVLVWDQNAERVPDGIKAVRNITEIHLLFD